MLLWDDAAPILCLLVQLSAKQRLCGCFGDALVKAKTDIKAGIRQARLRGYSTMSGLFRSGCRQRLHFANVRIHSCGLCCACAFLCVVYLHLPHTTQREAVTSQPPEYLSWDTVCAAGDKTPPKTGGARDAEVTTGGTVIAITENRQPRRREKSLLRQEAEKAERSRLAFLYIGLAADILRARPEQRARRAGVVTLL